MSTSFTKPRVLNLSKIQCLETRMSRQRSVLDRLGDDVFAHILSLSPITAVLSASEACKRLHDIVDTRQIWLALVSSLNARGMIDLRPGQRLQDLSKQELIEVAKRTQFGPQWSFQNPEAIQVSDRATVVLPEDKKEDIPANPMDIQAWAQAFLSRPPQSDDAPRTKSPVRMIPGGRYLMHFQPEHDVRIYDGHEGSLVWTYQSCWPECGVKDFAFQLADHGRSLEIVFILYSGSDSSRAQFIEALCLDLQTMEATPLYQYKVPRPEDTGFCDELILNEDYAIIGTSLRKCCYLMHIHDQKLHIIDVSKLNRYKLTLVRGILISLEVEPGLAAFRLAFHDTTKISPSSEAGLQQVQTILSEIIEILPSSQGLPRIQLSAHPSPTHHDVYHIWIFATFVNRVTGVFKYRLTLPINGETLHLKQLNGRWVGLPQLHLPSSFDISYHGHVVLFDMLGGQPSVLSLQDLLHYNVFPQWLDDSKARRRGQITTYSGVLAHGDIQDYEGKIEAEFYA